MLSLLCCAVPRCVAPYYAVMCCVKLCCAWLNLCSADKVLCAVLNCYYAKLRHAMQCCLCLCVNAADYVQSVNSNALLCTWKLRGGGGEVVG